ncbi:ABC transporter permease subunit [Isoptericola variabilis]|uniref:Uncharacterized protein n=1 Tax=Isoptericola variabilis (strain 225) TaxID=743718 RepID=F6FQK9_ISOV2|nr:ABC transporter permease subunit [Isoptericola variabilis]AEG44905.1 hypothetical protein Isova_2184 [Isoptericola variabilis 225]TWH28730.1 ABC-2 type transport system permease protein [Isoptericola variabilis J7]
MTRLLRVELRRLWARRLTRWMTVAVLAVVAITGASAFSMASPPTEAQIAEAERFYADELAWWEEHGEEQVASCKEDEAAQPEPVDWGCDDMAPRLEHFLPPTTTFVPSAEQRGSMGPESTDPAVAAVYSSLWYGWGGLAAAAQSATFLLVIAFVVAVSFVTAETSSGALGMWLTFEPRRQRVYWSKAAAAGLGTVPLVLLGWAAVVGVVYAAHAWYGTLGDVTPQVWGEVAAYTGRLVVAGAATAVVGVALGVLLRHAAAAIGAAVVLLWASSVFSYGLGELQRWMPALNLRAWVDAGATYGTTTSLVAEDGTYYEEWVERAVSQTQGGVYLLVLTALLTLVAVLVFRRRDVA